MQPPTVFMRRIIAPIVKRAVDEGRKLPALLLETVGGPGTATSAAPGAAGVNQEATTAAAPKTRNLFRCINTAPNLGLGRRLIKEEWLQAQYVTGESYYLLTHARLKEYDVTDGVALGVKFQQGLPQWSSPQPIQESTTSGWRLLPLRAEDIKNADLFRRLKVARDCEIIAETREEARKKHLKTIQRRLRAQAEREVKARKRHWLRR